MILLENKTNVNPPSPTFPYGDLRNDPGDNTGTPIDRVLMSDVMQTMERIMSQSGITANGQLDNETNGFQIYEAMQKLFGRSLATDWIDLPGASYIYPSAQGRAQILKDSNGFIHFRGVWSHDDPAPSMIVGTLPAGYRPELDIVFSYTTANVSNPSSVLSYEISISASTGVIDVSGSFSPQSIDCISFPSFLSV